MIAQKFKISLGEKKYWFELVYNERSSQYILDISDESENPLACGIPLVYGQNLLEAYQHIAPGVLYLIDTSGQYIDPFPIESFGVTTHLVWRG